MAPSLLHLTSISMQGHLDGISTLGRTHTSQLDALQARGLINTMATILGDLYVHPSVFVYASVEVS